MNGNTLLGVVCLHDYITKKIDKFMFCSVYLFIIYLFPLYLLIFVRMNTNKLEKVAEENNNFVMNNKVYIPETIEVLHGDLQITKCPIMDGNTIKTNVIFETMKPDDCAIHYIESDIGKNIVIMNFACRYKCCGNYLSGYAGQEEDLCRCMPGLYASLSKIKYPFLEDSVLVTSPTEIMRDNQKYNLFPRFAMYFVGVVGVAAPQLQHENFDEHRVRRTLENMYTSIKTYLPSTDTIILGAWGCGTSYLSGDYGNDPNVMSRIMNEVNLEYGGSFKNVVFSVPEGYNGRIFKNNIMTMKSNI
jgi:uncharacterized protein (TIGR02452 family)